MIKIIFCALLLNFTITFASEEPIVQFETVVQDVIFNTSSKITIDEETIKKSKASTVTSLISNQANITVTNTPFQPNSIYIRGGDASHVLIIIDGVPFYDASTIQRTINLNSLNLNSIRKIEILKGSQTVLYGGQAASGVIKIETIPQIIESQNRVQVSVGSNNLRDLGLLNYNKLSESQALLIHGYGFWRDSQSPVLDSKTTYPRNKSNADLVYAWRSDFDSNIKLTYIQDHYSSPSSLNNYQVVDDDTFTQDTNQLALSGNFNFKNLFLKPKLTLSTQKSFRGFDRPEPDLVDEDYNSQLGTVRLELSPETQNNFSFKIGTSYIYESFLFENEGIEQVDKGTEQKGLFALANYKLADNYQITLGLRGESWANQKSASTYQVGISIYENTKLEVSTGYKIPSLFQLYSKYGNSDLNEEKMTQYSLSHDFNFNNTNLISVTLFSSQFDDLIATSGSYPNIKYNNVNKAESKGVELVLQTKLNENLKLSTTYGYQEPRDLERDTWLQRRPLVNGSLRLAHDLNDIQSYQVELSGAGERIDRKSTTTYVSLSGYVTTNASYTHKLSDTASAYVRVNNILNNRFEETYSYHAEGTNGSLGLDYIF